MDTADFPVIDCQWRSMDSAPKDRLILIITDHNMEWMKNNPSYRDMLEYRTYAEICHWLQYKTKNAQSGWRAFPTNYKLDGNPMYWADIPLPPPF